MPGIPPPMPAGAAGAAGAGSGLSATKVSVVRTRAAMEAAFWRAVRVTLAGSTIPALTISTYSSLRALKPTPSSEALTLATMTEPSRPAFSAIWRSGASIARLTRLIPVCTSPSSLNSSRAGRMSMRVVPPPATIPSSTAARVALRASSRRYYLSFNSTSVAAPTSMTATPPDILAKRSCNFSLSKSDVVSAICALI